MDVRDFVVPNRLSLSRIPLCSNKKVFSAATQHQPGDNKFMKENFCATKHDSSKKQKNTLCTKTDAKQLAVMLFKPNEQ